MATRRPTADAIEQIKHDLMRDLTTIREHVLATGNEEKQNALAGVETFCAIALRVLAKTNPSKIRSEAVTVEIGARLAGKEVI